MQPTIALLIVAWLMSTRIRRLGPSESLLAAGGFTLAMLLLLYLYHQRSIADLSPLFCTLVISSTELEIRIFQLCDHGLCLARQLV